MTEQKYLKLLLSERQSHINLSEECNERGGNSTNHRGVLAEYLETPIFKKPIDLCHICHNGDCSNPRHLYWGSRKENIQDSIKNGTHSSPWERKVKKYGYEVACKMNARGGSASKGVPKKKKNARMMEWKT